MLVLSRFHRASGDESADVSSSAEFAERARAALRAFAACPGFVRGRLGRAADDPAWWTIATEWESVGAFRRSLSNFDVKVYAAPLLAESVEEPSAYEILTTAERAVDADSDDPVELVDHATARAADADDVRVGEAATGRAPREETG